MKSYYYTNDDGQWVGPLRQRDLVILYQHGTFSRSAKVKEKDTEDSAAIPFKDYPFAGDIAPYAPTVITTPAQPAYSYRRDLGSTLLRWLIIFLITAAIAWGIRIAALMMLQQYFPQIQQLMHQIQQVQQQQQRQTNPFQR